MSIEPRSLNQEWVWKFLPMETEFPQIVSFGIELVGKSQLRE